MLNNLVDIIHNSGILIPGAVNIHILPLLILYSFSEILSFNSHMSEHTKICFSKRNKSIIAPPQLITDD